MVLIAQAVFLLQRRQIDATERPTHTGNYAGVGNNCSRTVLSMLLFTADIPTYGNHIRFSTQKSTNFAQKEVHFTHVKQLWQQGFVAIYFRLCNRRKERLQHSDSDVRPAVGGLAAGGVDSSCSCPSRT